MLSERRQEMLRRRTMGEKKMIEVVEEITATGNWTVPAGCQKVDVFLVGGGAGGAYAAGGGGYTKIFYDIPVTPGASIPCIIGAGGGLGGMSYGDSKNGGHSQFMNTSYRALGGKIVIENISPSNANTTGGDGGSGGAGYIHAQGGTDGSDGQQGTGTADVNQKGLGGKGQGSSTRCPFNNKLYATGGSTGTGITSPDGYYQGNIVNLAYRHGRPNTGEGGSGSGWYGGNGGSGIIVLRYRKYAV